MWCVDVILDLPWFVERKGKLGGAAASIALPGNEGEPPFRGYVYGDDEKIRHLRITIATEDHATADYCIGNHINRWVWRVEVASLMATPTFTTCANVARNSAAFMVCQFQGDENSDALILDGSFESPAKADLISATRIFGCWKANFENHLTFLSRFLNSALPPDVRWQNGYRLMEWHFLRGDGDLQRNEAYRVFLAEHGAALDPFLRRTQTRWGLMEEIRALTTHAMSWSVTDPRTDGGKIDPILKTFSALEGLVAKIMNQGTVEGVEFKQNFVCSPGPGKAGPA